MTSADLLHTASLFDTPHTQVSMQREQIARTCGLDLSACNVCTIVTALNDYDLARIEQLGHRFDRWPDDVRAIMEKELAGFSERNNGAKVEAVTQAIGGTPKAFILCLHWRPKS